MHIFTVVVSVNRTKIFFKSIAAKLKQKKKNSMFHFKRVLSLLAQKTYYFAYE